jgi:hypothetical protein
VETYIPTLDLLLAAKLLAFQPLVLVVYLKRIRSKARGWRSFSRYQMELPHLKRKINTITIARIVPPRGHVAHIHI